MTRKNCQNTKGSKSPWFIEDLDGLEKRKQKEVVYLGTIWSKLSLEYNEGICLEKQSTKITQAIS